MTKYSFKIDNKNLKPTGLLEILYKHLTSTPNEHEDGHEHWFMGIAGNASVILNIWPAAFDIQEVEDQTVGVHDNWILPLQLFPDGGIYEIKFSVPTPTITPSETSASHSCSMVGFGHGHSKWIGYFDTLEDVRRYWPTAFAVEILKYNLTPDKIQVNKEI